MKILITGGGGFLGSHLVDAFLKRGDEVVVLDTSPDLKVRHNLSNPRFRYIQNSIFEKDLLESLVAKADLIYHLAAVVGVEHYVGDPLNVLNVNVNGTQQILKLALRYEKKIVFSSTSEVYGKNPNIPFKEDESDRVLGPTSIDRWCYSTSKAIGEHFCFAYAKLGLKMVIVRYFNIYGPRLDWIDKGRVITIFMGQLLRGEDITVIGDGMQTRCFTYVDDAIQATVAAGLKPEAEGQIFNIGTDVETTIKELAETMIQILPTGSKIRYVNQEEIYGKSYEDIPRRVPSIEKMKKILGVEPSTSLKDGLTKTIEWFREEFPKMK
ncbi:MAG: NAD-dependent epimerase/dehydratase family protein [Planctomycetota bacterium]|nr:MAG: NAD-dependent epimerase/dehydratase family protein [Planctomycetota bacterium]